MIEIQKSICSNPDNERMRAIEFGAYVTYVIESNLQTYADKSYLLVQLDRTFSTKEALRTNGNYKYIGFLRLL